MRRTIFVYADWEQFNEPVLVGLLRSTVIRGAEHFSFEYTQEWLASDFALQLDPNLELFVGEQHNTEQQNFRIFLDSCPDTWGRVLMKRREAVIARNEKRKPQFFNESDYLLGVHDLHRMGALRFKLDRDGRFLDDNEDLAAPPMASLRELQYAASKIADEDASNDPDYLKWLNMLMSPGSSLGGARPKASITDGDNLWIAKFPNKNDTYDVGAWEFVVHQLALSAKIKMSPCRLEKFNNPHHTFLTQRFDRTQQGRLHFTSAMMQLGYNDGEDGASYLEIAEFIFNHGSNTKEDLAQLWRRIVFNISVSNTDDHLRNHGFIYHNNGWILSPAYDLNPITPAQGLHLNINETDNSLDYDLAMEVIEYFQLNEQDAITIKNDVLASVQNWQQVATDIGLSRAEQLDMSSAFNI